MKPHRIITSSTYNSQPVNINGSGCHGEILDLIQQRMDNCLRRFNRVHVARLDITFPDNYLFPGNRVFYNFLWMLRQAMGGEVFDYVWVKERNRSVNPHFHLVIFRNGQQYCSGYAVWQKAIEVWGKLLKCDAEGLIHAAIPTINNAYCNYGVVIDRNAVDFQKVYSSVHYWLSYMAKVNTKTTQSGHAYGSSQLRC